MHSGLTADRLLGAASAVALAAGQVVPPGIRRVGAASGSNVAPAADVSVAVLDSGVFLSHPDLNVQAGELVAPMAQSVAPGIVTALDARLVLSGHMHVRRAFDAFDTGSEAHPWHACCRVMQQHLLQLSMIGMHWKQMTSL